MLAWKINDNQNQIISLYSYNLGLNDCIFHELANIQISNSCIVFTGIEHQNILRGQTLNKHLESRKL